MINLNEPLYIVLFESRDPESFTPVVETITTVEQYLAMEVTFPFGFDKKLIPILEILWYCLHLPRTRFDSGDITANAQQKLQLLHLPHHIQMLPVPCPSAILSNLKKNRWPKIVFAQDDLIDAAEDIIGNLENIVETVRASQINESMLIHHWELLHSKLELNRTQYTKPSRIITDRHLRTALIPTQFVARQMRGGSDDAVPASFSQQSEVID